jgi:hypothetical protein
LLFFAFEHDEVPDHVLEPVLKKIPHLQPGYFIYHLKDHRDPESTRYYGSTDIRLMDNLRQALGQQGLSFQEVQEEDLPDWERQELADIRSNS